MEFCKICTASFDSDDRRIRCSGQRCDQAFHQRCVHLTEDDVRSWLADDVGLFWFCLTCRLEFAKAATSSREDMKRKLDEEGGPSKRSRMESSPRLPPEVWTMIFRNLDSRWLARVRLVCRDWNELVIARQELMDRFLLKLGTAQFVEDLDEVRHFLVLGGGFTRAEFDCRDLGKDKPRVAWFMDLGQSLTTLSCKSTPFGFLYELLRALPNLRRLQLDDCFEYGKSVKPKYQLTKLEELTILSFKNKNHGGSIFPVLAHICPKIKVFKFCEENCYRFVNDIGLFVQAVRQTLQGLKLIASTTELINKLVTMNDLHLKRLTINCNKEDLLRLIRRQPTLERLHFHKKVSNLATLAEISRILPNIKGLKLAEVQPGQNPPLNLFPRLELIRARYVNSSDCVSCFLGPSLQRLELFDAYLLSEILIDLPQIATQIKSVSFSGCTIERSSDLLSFVQQSKSLDTFKLNWVRVKTEDDMPDIANGRSRIRHLKFSSNSKEILHALIEFCPDMETLDIEHSLVENDMLKMGQRLKRLKSLKLIGCRSYGHGIRIECLRPIPYSFEALNKLQITACVIPQVDVEHVLQGLRKDIDFSIEYTISYPPPPYRRPSPSSLPPVS